MKFLTHPSHPPAPHRVWKRGVCRAFIASFLIPALGSSLLAVDPAPLAATRATFLRQALTDSQILTEQYERALARLEQELAASADYEEAMLVQQRRAELKALYSTTDSGLAQSLAIPLPSSSAKTLGSTEVRGDLLTGWRTTGSMAEWSNLKVAPGRYYLEFEVNMVQVPILGGGMVSERAQPLERLAFEFFEVSLLPGASENRRSFELGTSSDDAAFTPQRIGPLKITRNSVTFRLAASTGYPANVARFRNLRLVPATEEAPAVADTTQAAISAQSIRSNLMSSLQQLQKNIIDSYLADLSAQAKMKPDVEDQIDTEIKRVRKLLTEGNPANALVPRSMISLGGLAGFEALDDAHLVSDEASNTGDRFVIEHEGKHIPIRLLWVQCAPADNQKDTSSLKSFAKHFGIEEEDAGAMGRLAKEFTAGYLEGKSLRVLIRPGKDKVKDKDKETAAPALVFLPQIGLFQNALIDQGLAAVQAPNESRRSLMENALISGMLQREDKARRQKSPSGAWALSAEGGRETR